MKITDVHTHDVITLSPHKKIITTTPPIQLVPPLSVNIATNLLINTNNNFNIENNNINSNNNMNNNNKNNNNDIKPSVPLPNTEIDDTAKILRDHDLHNKEKYTKNNNEVHVEDRKSKENRIMNLNNPNNVNSKVSNDGKNEEQSNVGNGDKDTMVPNDGKEELKVIEDKSHKDETVLKGVGTIKGEVGTIIEEVATMKEGSNTVNIRGQMQDREEEGGIVKEGVDIDTKKEGINTKIEEINTLKVEVDTIKEEGDVVYIRGQMHDREEVVSTVTEKVDTDIKKLDINTLKKEIETINEGADTISIRGQIQERMVEKNEIGGNKNVGYKKGGDKENSLIADNNLTDTVKDGGDTVNIRGPVQERSVEKNEVGANENVGEKKGGDKENNLIADNNLTDTVKDGGDTVNIRGQIQDRIEENERVGEEKKGGDKENNLIANDLPILGLTPLAGRTVRGEGINNAEKDRDVANIHENNGVRIGSDRCANEEDPFMGTGPVEVLIYSVFH
jgi:hypothetical protein